jgi:hypothetical protein
MQAEPVAAELGQGRDSGGWVGVTHHHGVAAGGPDLLCHLLGLASRGGVVDGHLQGRQERAGRGGGHVVRQPAPEGYVRHWCKGPGLQGMRKGASPWRRQRPGPARWPCQCPWRRRSPGTLRAPAWSHVSRRPTRASGGAAAAHSVSQDWRHGAFCLRQPRVAARVAADGLCCRPTWRGLGGSGIHDRPEAGLYNHPANGPGGGGLEHGACRAPSRALPEEPGTASLARVTGTEMHPIDPSGLRLGPRRSLSRAQEQVAPAVNGHLRNTWMQLHRFEHGSGRALACGLCREGHRADGEGAGRDREAGERCRATVHPTLYVIHARFAAIMSKVNSPRRRTCRRCGRSSGWRSSGWWPRPPR